MSFILKSNRFETFFLDKYNIEPFQRKIIWYASVLNRIILTYQCFCVLWKLRWDHGIQSYSVEETGVPWIKKPVTSTMNRDVVLVTEIVFPYGRQTYVIRDSCISQHMTVLLFWVTMWKHCKIQTISHRPIIINSNHDDYINTVL